MKLKNINRILLGNVMYRFNNNWQREAVSGSFTIIIDATDHNTRVFVGFCVGLFVYRLNLMRA